MATHADVVAPAAPSRRLVGALALSLAVLVLELPPDAYPAAVSGAGTAVLAARAPFATATATAKETPA